MTENRFSDLYRRAQLRGYREFTPFLNMEEQSRLNQTRLECVKFGGYGNAERVVAGFGEYVEESDFPILCIKISPLSQKFAENLSHRDCLGALMNLGIKRELIGDIIISEKSACVFCLEKIATYICDNLKKIRHTSVKAELSDIPEIVSAEVESEKIIVASLRVDVMICAVYKLSRNEAVRLVEAQKVFVNSSLVTGVSHTLSQNDVVSVRGYGRFVYVKTISQTKKGRLSAEVKIYR